MKNITINEELNGIEIAFDSKPDAATLDALKAAGFRWHKVKKLWYAKNTPERMTLAETIGDASPAAIPAARPSKVNEINLDNLGENKPHLYGAELAKAIREDLKRRGVTGVTVRARKITYDTGITVTVKASPEDFASLEEMKERYNRSRFSCDIQTRHGLYTGGRWLNYSDYEKMTETERDNAHELYLRESAEKISSFSEHEHINKERNNYYELTTAFYNKLRAIYKIANQWNYDNSDIMTDYFDVGYYLDIDIKRPEAVTIRESMTDAERIALATEREEEEKARAAALEAYQKEQEESQKAAEEARKKREAARALVLDDITVEDLPEENQLYITDLAGGAGKETTLAELLESIKDYGTTTDAVVTRKVTFTSPAAYNAFCEILLDSFDFLTGKGGTGTDDIRLENVKHIYELTSEQRASVKWYECDCVAVYLNDKIKLVCDPQGHDYSRYTYILTDASRILNAKEEATKQAAESREKAPFYFPEKVAEQVKKLSPGQRVTVYQCDGWILNNVYGGSGVIKEIKPGSYAQYTGIYLALDNGRTTKNVFIRDNHECLIYNDILPALPEAVTRRQCSANMYELLNYNELFPAILDYYGKQGKTPIIDTIQR